MTMTSRHAWFTKPLDHVQLHIFSNVLLYYCCWQLSGCWLIFSACPYTTWLHINLLCLGELIVPAHTLPMSTHSTPHHVGWRIRASVDLANVHTGLRIRTLELHADNPIRVSPDYHTDQPDPVWVMLKKGTRLELGVRTGDAAKKSAVWWSDILMIRKKLSYNCRESCQHPALISNSSVVVLSCSGF